jgi:hypothetical protein
MNHDSSTKKVNSPLSRSRRAKEKAALSKSGSLAHLGTGNIDLHRKQRIKLRKKKRINRKLF